MKHIVIDTNVLLSDPTAPFKFAEHRIIIPTTVLHELDNIKDRRDKAEVSAEAREAIRIIDSIIGTSKPDEIKNGVPIAYPEGLKNEKGTLAVFNGSRKEIELIINEHELDDSPDSKIIATTLLIQKQNKNEKTVLVTLDVNMRLIASASGVENVEGYKNERALDDVDYLTSGFVSLKEKSFDELNCEIAFEDNGDQILQLPIDKIESPYIGLSVSLSDNENTYVGVVKSIDNNFITILMKDMKKMMAQNVWGIKPKDQEQAIAVDMLMDPDVELVALFGPAGSGKTLLSLAASIEQVIEEKRYDKIICTRPVVDLDADIGALPGTEEDKMRSWLVGFYDALETMHKNDEKSEGKNGVKSMGSEEYVIQKANIQFKSITYFRGASFNKVLLLIDESQNLTRHQIKAITSRVGPGSKIVFMGNISQIDRSYVSATTSGLTHLVVKSKLYEKSRSFHLPNIERSGLAKFAEQHL